MLALRFLSALTFSNLTMPTFVLPQVAALSKTGRLTVIDQYRNCSRMRHAAFC